MARGLRFLLAPAALQMPTLFVFFRSLMWWVAGPFSMPPYFRLIDLAGAAVFMENRRLETALIELAFPAGPLCRDAHRCDRELDVRGARRYRLVTGRGRVYRQMTWWIPRRGRDHPEHIHYMTAQKMTLDQIKAAPRQGRGNRCFGANVGPWTTNDFEGGGGGGGGGWRPSTEPDN